MAALLLPFSIKSHAAEDTTLPTAKSDSAFTTKAASPIRSADGRTRYIVDLVDDDTDKPAKFDDEKKFTDYRKKRSASLIDAAVKLRDIQLFSSTSVVDTSFTAYLTEKQLDQLAKDKRVKLITPDVYLEPSALWTASTDYSGQTRDWGLYAMGVAQAGSSNGTAAVYVLDSGVEPHVDLPGLIRTSALPGINLSGCYPHATHVAGIIGAADNGTGVVGVFPGVKIQSIAVGDTNVGGCSQNYALSAFIQALDVVFSDVLFGRKAAIVNISFNADQGVFSSTSTLGSKMRTVATPFSFFTGSYQGAFIVQSAGNDLQDACGVAYNAPSGSDGIMVVGGLDDNGQRVTPLATPDALGRNNGYINRPIAENQPGSNTGFCVEAWAPSQRIKSTWANGSYALLSGTSMAAPHVAGLAARLLESNPGMTSIGIEAAVLARMSTIAGSNLSIPQLSPQSMVAQPTVEIAERGTRTPINAINFYDFASQINLRFGASGASYCSVYITQNGYFYDNYWVVPSSLVNLPVTGLPQGATYNWTVTCYSPQNTTTTVSAGGYIKRTITAYWMANTTSTGGNWQYVNSGDLVTWANGGAFTQYYFSSGADYCQVQSFGTRGNIFNDSEKPGYPGYDAFSPPFSQTTLWDSGPYFPTSYQFGIFYLGNPNTAAPPLGPYEGYKWRLACRNWEGDYKVRVMYGRLQ